MSRPHHVDDEFVGIVERLLPDASRVIENMLTTYADGTMDPLKDDRAGRVAALAKVALINEQEAPLIAILWATAMDQLAQLRTVGKMP